MKTSITTILILLVTLSIGMLLGSLLHGAVMKNRMERHFSELRRPKGFINSMEDFLELEGPQKETVHKILERHHKILGEYRVRMETLMDSLKQELRQHLTEDQIKRLEAEGPRRGPIHGPPGKRRKNFSGPDSIPEGKPPWERHEGKDWDEQDT